MGSDIARLHHVGHVVGDLPSALERYRRLGFVVAPPSYPAMARGEDGEPEPFGAANTHADFADGFLELATPVREGDALPPDANVFALTAPPEGLPLLVERIATTSANLAACLDRFEGLHILMFSSPDIDAVATRLTASEVGHGGVNTVRRPVETEAGTVAETVRYLEIDGVGMRHGSVEEGRVGVVADLDGEIQGARSSEHPNGAIALVEAVLCVADDELTTVVARYERYFGLLVRSDGPAWAFDLEAGRLTLVPASRLEELLPAMVACAVGVRDVFATEEFLRGKGFSLGRTADGAPFVPSAEALGAAIVFRSV
ncbi:VOC family protein [Amycolatopsis sp. cmx-11-51]|uniref:VOC family protein n=1 Tax=Amycolatopsis sp. cmx-11-51 TaxID=2785797 RepID=UPI0039E27C0B